jgi:DNA polymerase elongation subunit (family B)
MGYIVYIIDKMNETFNINDLLYGHDSTEGIVSIEVSGNLVFEYIQDKEGNVHRNIHRGYQPWIYEHTSEPNTDNINYFNTIRRLRTLKDYKYLRTHRNTTIKLPNMESNYLIDTGKTLFKGLQFDEVHAAGWDIETTGLNPETCIVKMISIADNRGYKKVLYNEDERQLILDFVKEIKELDPSILYSYYGSHFDVPFMLHRCKVHDVRLSLGRDGSEPLPTKIRVRLGVGMDDLVDNA